MNGILNRLLSKKDNQFVSFKFSNDQFFEVSTIHGGATSLDSFLKTYKTSEQTKGFFHDWFSLPDKLNNKELRPFEAFHNKLQNCNPPEKEYLDYEKLIGGGWTTESVLVKMRLFKKLSTRAKNYFYLQKVRELGKMQSVKDFLR